MDDCYQLVNQLSNISSENIQVYKTIGKLLKQYGNLSAAYENDSLLRSLLIKGLDQYKPDKFVKSVISAYARQELLLEKYQALDRQLQEHYKHLIETSEQACKVLESIAKKESDTQAFNAIKADLLSRTSYQLAEVAKDIEIEGKINSESLLPLYNDCVNYNILEGKVEHKNQLEDLPKATINILEKKGKELKPKLKISAEDKKKRGNGKSPKKNNDKEEKRPRNAKKEKYKRSDFKPLTESEAKEIAEQLGYRYDPSFRYNSKDVKAYRKGDRWISRDLDGHNGGYWKMFDRKGRIATLTKFLEREVGP